ncbi:hypothetical protein EVAR_73428_1 [Eumeta japonica]|uniref:Uncharacterized protein n=1 Tax=Eumeta variegata TaxID=151549 RepID=A0A4C1SCZ4_EUMVA|nr:hypothetical protein EVAR_73428_1 [Eumeta japonica]
MSGKERKWERETGQPSALGRIQFCCYSQSNANQMDNFYYAGAYAHRLTQLSYGSYKASSSAFKSVVHFNTQSIPHTKTAKRWPGHGSNYGNDIANERTRKGMTLSEEASYPSLDCPFTILEAYRAFL